MQFYVEYVGTNAKAARGHLETVAGVPPTVIDAAAAQLDEMVETGAVSAIYVCLSGHVWEAGEQNTSANVQIAIRAIDLIVAPDESGKPYA